MTVVAIAHPRRERKKAAARQRIIATAIDLFARHGLDNVTVEHIADVADLGKGTIYNYFQTKEEIVVAYMVEKEIKLQARIARLAASRGSLASILTGYLRFQFLQKRPYHGFVRVFLAQMFAGTEQFLASLVEMQKSIDENLNALFSRLQARGLARKDVPAADLVAVFKTLHLGLTALWAIEGPPFGASERVLKQEIKLFCQGIRGEKREQREP
jgi:AcrR family transcriptional regulator